MKHRTFFWFVLPTVTAMLLFIALPIVSVLVFAYFLLEIILDPGIIGIR